MRCHNVSALDTSDTLEEALTRVKRLSQTARAIEAGVSALLASP